VPYKRFEQALNRRLAQETGQVEEEKLAALKAAVIQDMVQETVFLQEADRYGLGATDNEVAAMLRGIPAFQQDGVFHQSLYLNILHQNLRTTPVDFEEDRRRDIRRQKLLLLLSSGIKVSEGEMRDRLARMPEKQRKELEKDPEQIRQSIGQEQGNAAFQLWVQQVNQNLKVENRLDRWEKLKN
jgi:peptidyl-prolyl cis-trans isomerase D